MKIVTFWGGLGNQIFEYFYYLWLKDQNPTEKIYAYYPSKGLAAHNGLEIDKRFDAVLPKSSNLTNLIGGFLFNTNRLCLKLRLPLLFTCTNENGKYNAIFHCDYWQDKKYMPKDFALQFKLDKFEAENEMVLKIIESKNTVAVHVRRGDYTTSDNMATYGGICTEGYYAKALAEVLKRVENPQFIFFSDDPEYVRENYNYPNMIIVDWNKKDRSIYDMYLMSKCKYMVLANSTFSYWAARLNRNVISVWCPSKWTNFNEPKIILDGWNTIK